MPHDSASATRSLLAGGFGGVCDVLIAYPLDLITVRLQTAAKGTYKGPIDVARQAIASHGSLLGLYKGVSAPLFGVAPMYALSFYAYDLGKQLVTAISPTQPKSQPLSMPQIAIAGAISSAPFVVIGIPFDRAKIILNLQAQRPTPPPSAPLPRPIDNVLKASGTHATSSSSISNATVSAAATNTIRYKGTLHVLSSLFTTHGITELYRGLTITLIRDIPAGAAYFVTYEGLKRFFNAEGTKGPKWPIYMLSGSAAHIAMIASIFPLDTIKTRIQGKGLAAEGLGVEVRRLWRQGGLRAFYPGFVPAVVREGPAGAVTFLGFEVAMAALGRVAGEVE